MYEGKISSAMLRENNKNLAKYIKILEVVKAWQDDDLTDFQAMIKIQEIV